MKSMIARATAAAFLAGAACGAPHANAALVLDLTAPGTPEPCGPSCGASGTTYGWAFDVTTPITVDGIGVWDSNSGGPFSSEAGLFTSSGTLLESALISSATSTPVASANTDGQWLFETFAPITLPIGLYLIGNVSGESSPLAEIGATFVTIPQITFVVGVIGPTDGGFSAPTGSFSPTVFGPTLETTIPEPSTWAMMLLGFVGLGYAGYRAGQKGTLRHSPT
jgi:PEP-CTERM motif